MFHMYNYQEKMTLDGGLKIVLTKVSEKVNYISNPRMKWTRKALKEIRRLILYLLVMIKIILQHSIIIMVKKKTTKKLLKDLVCRVDYNLKNLITKKNT